MIKKCMAGKIDMIITKSVSRFARNTVDCLQTIRKLKEKNIGILFEKEGAYTGISGRRFRKHPGTKPEVSGHFAG
jgi:DNA invertase Pin-like site-specific DNA recombinase